jgi:hypothetical protein
VFFIFHVERTGGTTLRHILRLHYGWNSPLMYPHYNEYDGVPLTYPFVRNERTDKARYFIGHEIYYGIHKAIGKPHHYLTILRDPFERMLSLFNYCRFYNAERNLPVETFEQWFEHWKNSDQVWALQRDRTPTLEGAKTILEDMSFIGLNSTLQEDIDQLFYPYYYQEALNTTKIGEHRSKLPALSFTDEQEKLVRKALERDYDMYNHAINLRKQGINDGFHLPEP